MAARVVFILSIINVRVSLVESAKLKYPLFPDILESHTSVQKDWYGDVEVDNFRKEHSAADGVESLNLSGYEVVVPKQLSTHTKDNSDLLYYSIQLEGKTYTLSLKKQIFIPKDLQIFIDEKEETELFKYILTMSDCYHHGRVLESERSSVTLRTCFGLRGMVEFHDESFFIQPFELDSGFQHLVYKMVGYTGSSIIAVNDTDLKSQSYQQKLFEEASTAKPRKSIFRTTRYLEIDIYVTVEVYKALGSSPSNTISNVIQMFSYLNAKFLPLNLHVFLSQINIWTVSDFSPQAETLSGTLENFFVWLSGVPAHLKSSDMSLLIVAGPPSEVGTTYFGQMCSANSGAVVTFPKGLSFEKYSCLVAHILGHSLGMLHDNNRECKCPSSICIMDTKIMGAANVRSFSSCSLRDFETFVVKTGASCLLTLPDLKSIADPSLCGNKMLERGETCDCGTETECKNDTCCDYKTCRLKPGARCAHGACCANCQFVPAGVLCRASEAECDLPEFCSGTEAACGSDIYQQNGNPCNNKAGVCFNGKCQSADLQCQQMFGPDSRSASYECYRELNIIGDRFGNCGGVRGFYAKCQIEDVLCGKVQCAITGEAKVAVANVTVSFYTPKNETCLNADYITQDLVDPVKVKDGTKCGENKICIRQKCRHFSQSDYSCERDTTCNGHGVCNSKHNCHCDIGWKSAFCNEPDERIGFKSIKQDVDINAELNTNGEDLLLRNWLLIGFFLILPIIIIVVVITRMCLLHRCSQWKEYQDEEKQEEEETEVDEEEEEIEEEEEEEESKVEEKINKTAKQ